MKSRAPAASQQTSVRGQLEEVYQRLLSHYGPQHWWPADGPFEVIIGAILTQQTTWRNVHKAISNLKQAQALDAATLRQLPLEQLSALIYPCGYYRAKARKLKAFAEHLAGYGDSLPKLFALPLDRLRAELLSIYGIGEETADSIILYASGKPIFVVDAYTRRIMQRLGLVPAKNDYASFQALFMDNLSRDREVYNEYHALLVRHGKETCRTRPLCPNCCLRAFCPHWGQAS